MRAFSLMLRRWTPAYLCLGSRELEINKLFLSSFWHVSILMDLSQQPGQCQDIIISVDCQKCLAKTIVNLFIINDRFINIDLLRNILRFWFSYNSEYLRNFKQNYCIFTYLLFRDILYRFFKNKLFYKKIPSSSQHALGHK